MLAPIVCCSGGIKHFRRGSWLEPREQRLGSVVPGAVAVAHLQSRGYTGYTGYTGHTGYTSVSQVFDKVRQGEVAGAGAGENTQLSVVQTLISTFARYKPASVHLFHLRLAAWWGRGWLAWCTW